MEYIQNLYFLKRITNENNFFLSQRTPLKWTPLKIETLEKGVTYVRS